MNRGLSTPSGRSPRAAPAPRRPLSRVQRLAGTLAVILAVVVVVRLRSGGARTVPDELLGTWTTSAPGYADRALELTPTTLRLHMGASPVHDYPIRRVLRRETGASTVFTIEYERDGDRDALSFRFVGTPHPAIRIEHQSFVWRRDVRR